MACSGGLAFSESIATADDSELGSAEARSAPMLLTPEHMLCCCKSGMPCP